MSGERCSHWERVYETKKPAEVSWFQSDVDATISRIQRFVGSDLRGLRVLDAGSGASTIVDVLLEQGAMVTAVDISAQALEHTRARQVAAHRNRLTCVVADLCDISSDSSLRVVPDRSIDFWHDRAAFHFLIDESDRHAYAHNLRRILCPGGSALFSSFALDGPERCSGLPVARQNGVAIACALTSTERTFELVGEECDEHITPWGSVQRFAHAMLRASDLAHPRAG